MKHPRWTLTALSALALMPACGILERSPESGYAAHGSPANHRASADGEGEAMNVDSKVRLKQLENSIQTRKELEQYSRALPYLKNGEERIQFLSMPDYEARQKWMRDQDFNSRTRDAADNYQEVIEAQDIGIGMTQAMVKKSWGDPEIVEVSGNPLFRNERWRYNKYVSTPDGYKAEKKNIYFEGGRVSGWEVE